jgi:hypothetical protein
MPSWARALVASVLLTALAACTPEEAPAARSNTPAPGQTPTKQAEDAPGYEARAESATLETWALLYVAPPWTAGQEVKVVWRSTGAGDFNVVAVGPQSQRVEPVSGPTEHTGSNWARPGEEWGTFFRLDEPGEWVLRVERGPDTASLPITVTAI